MKFLQEKQESLRIRYLLPTSAPSVSVRLRQYHYSTKPDLITLLLVLNHAMQEESLRRSRCSCEGTIQRSSRKSYYHKTHHQISFWCIFSLWVRENACCIYKNNHYAQSISLVCRKPGVSSILISWCSFITQDGNLCFSWNVKACRVKNWRRNQANSRIHFVRWVDIRKDALRGDYNGFVLCKTEEWNKFYQSYCFPFMYTDGWSQRRRRRGKFIRC